MQICFRTVMQHNIIGKFNIVMWFVAKMVNLMIMKLLFEKDWISGTEFFREINTKSYYLIFVGIQAYPVGKNKTQIKTYNDFLNSECEMVFLCVDSIYVQIYSKNEQLLNKILGNCKRFQFEVKEITLQMALNRTLVAF